MIIFANGILENYWQDVFLNLRDKKIVVDSVSGNFHPKRIYWKFYEEFDGAIVDLERFFSLERIIEINRDNHVILDYEAIKFFESVEREYYTITDRYNFVPRSFRYRKRLFRESIRFWINFFKTRKIDLAFYPATPHDCSGFTSFHAAKFLGIKTLIISQTMINDHIMLRQDYRDHYKIPATYLPDAGDSELKDIIGKELLDSAMAESNALKYFSSLNKQALEAGGVKKLANKRREFKDIPQLHGKMGDFTSKRGIMYMDAVVPRIVRVLAKRYDKALRRKAMEQYQNLCIKDISLGSDFVYFPLQLQPERTSMPEAEVFEDQILALAMLRKAIPKDWKIYVKENPRQYDAGKNYLKWKNNRDLLDYKMIMALPNVELIAMDANVEELMEKSRFVCTVAGSSGWESLKKLKPCIVFANTWYSSCASCYRISNLDDLKIAIDKCVNYTKQEVYSNILRFLAFNKESFLKGSMGDKEFLKSASIPYEENVKIMADGLAKHL